MIGFKKKVHDVQQGNTYIHFFLSYFPETIFL